jgi:hypothetical protein
MLRWLVALAIVASPLVAHADDVLDRMTGQDEWRERRRRPDTREALRIFEEALRRWALASAHMAWQRERMDEIRRELEIEEDDPRPPPMSDADRAQRIQDVLAGRRAMRPDEFDDEGQAVDRESPLPELGE